MSNLNINGTIFIPSNATVTTSTLLKAKSIILGNNVTIEDGVSLISEESIEVTPESIIHPDANLKNARYSNLDKWRCPDVEIKTLQADDNEIKDQLCDDANYRNKVLSKRGNEDESTDITSSSKPNFNFTLKPNPAEHNLSLTLSTNIEDDINVSVLDIVGKEVFSAIQLKAAKDQSLINLDVSELNNGVYFCAFTNTKGARVVKKFIVAK